MTADITDDVEAVSDVWLAIVSVVEEVEEEEMTSGALLETRDEVCDGKSDVRDIGTDVDVFPSTVVVLIGTTGPRSEVRDEDVIVESDEEEEEEEEREVIMLDEEG